MAHPLSATKFRDSIRGEGVRVVEVGSWRTHNRGQRGTGWGPLNGVMVHHTVTRGTASSVALCRDGYSSLPGPLCHGVIDKDGAVHLVGYGRANHAGSGDDDVLRAVIAERSLPADNESNVDGNSRFYGFECINMGDNRDPWPEVQVEAIARAAAGICRAHGWGAASVIGHHEWQPGKVDPRGPIGKRGGPALTMGKIRARVAQLLDAAPNTTPPPVGGTAHTPQEDDDMKLNDPVKLGPWVRGTFPKQEGLQDNEISVNTALGSGYAYSHLAADNSTRILAQLGAQQATIDKLVDAIGDAGGITAEQVKAAAEQGAQSALDRLADALGEQEG